MTVLAKGHLITYKNTLISNKAVLLILQNIRLGSITSQNYAFINSFKL
jgi:hypothetical protein